MTHSLNNYCFNLPCISLQDLVCGAYFHVKGILFDMEYLSEFIYLRMLRAVSKACHPEIKTNMT